MPNQKMCNTKFVDRLNTNNYELEHFFDNFIFVWFVCKSQIIFPIFKLKKSNNKNISKARNDAFSHRQIYIHNNC